MIFIILASVIGALALGTALSYWIVQNIRAFTDDFFEAYPKQTQAVLDKIGEGQIICAYVVRVPLAKWMVFALNILSSYVYQQHIGDCDAKYPHHTALLCEVKTPKNGTKFILIDKQRRVHIRDDFVVTSGWGIMRVPIVNPDGVESSITVTEMLNLTRGRIGDPRFFNWDLYRNNCNRLTHELVMTLLKQRGDCVVPMPQTIRRFIHGHNQYMLRLIARRDDFAIHILSCGLMLYNMTENYFMDMMVFRGFF
jgi:hypothetical protein